MAEAAAAATKALRGTRLLSEMRDEAVQIATTPKDQVWREDKVTLHRYRPLAEQKVGTPVLIVYGLIGRWTMADLQEDRSLVRNLLGQGIDLWVVDWGNPSRADRWLALDDYIEGYLGDCVDEIRERTGSDKVSLLGICEGGVFTTAYAALEPERVNGAGQHHHPHRLPRRRGARRRGAPGLRLHQPLDPQPAAGGDRPADRRPWQPARPFHGRGVLDDDADALAR